MSYENFAAYYDLLTENVEYEKRAEYVCGLLSELGVPDGLLLDLACGTGRLSVLLAKRGYEVIGVDQSADMLCEARENAAGSGAELLLLCQRMEELDLYGTIRSCVCTLDSINHLLSPDAVRNTFQKVSLFLEPGGVFLFDVNTPYKHEAVLGDETFVYDLDEVFAVWRNQYYPETREVGITLDFFEADEECYYRSSEEFRERAYTDEELTAWLLESGFEVLHRFEELSHEPPKADTQRIVYAARKK